MSKDFHLRISPTGLRLTSLKVGLANVGNISKRESELMYSRPVYGREPIQGKLFRDRADAARQLAAQLYAYRGGNPLVLAIPRGAVPMGRILADELGGQLDVVLVRKLRAPFSPEFAVGAIEESGWAHIADHAAGAGADEAYLRREKETQLEALRARRKLYTPARAPLDPAGRNVIVVDDGLATGETMIAALHAVRSRKPARLVCAVPVAAPDSLERVAPYAQEIVCLHAPRDFYAVGQFYDTFSQIEDEEVVALLGAEERTHP